MPNLQSCSIEPFLYDAAPLDPVSAMEQLSVMEQPGQGGGGDAIGPFAPSIGAPQASSSSNQINEQKIENYLNRLREAICADLTAIDVRLTALEEV